MVSTYTTNIQLEEPARGDQVGTWDTPVNNNMTLIDLVVGGRTTINGAAGSVVLAAAQYQCKTITINSTLLASITLTFPTSFTKSYEIYNTCTGTSAFYVVLTTTAAGGQQVCCPPGDICEVLNDGTNIRFKNLGHIGTWWDYAGSSVPSWVSNCTVPPYLNCDGTTFSSATYPQLAVILGSTTLPDIKGSVRLALDQGAGRLSSAVTGGLSGTVVGSRGGLQGTTLGTSNLPAYTPSGTITVINAANTPQTSGGSIQGGPGPGSTLTSVSFGTVTATFAGNAQGGVSAPFTNLPPACIGGLMMIRAG